MSTKTRWFFAIAALGALLGLFYSGYSTSDFIAHLDRQLHPVNCSLLPGLTETSQISKEAQGCTVAMFSPYSSFWRDKYWGGVPISLFGMGLFGFALALAAWGFASGRGHKLMPSLFLLFSGLVAVATSLVFFSISMSELHTLCKLCVGTYVGSGVLLLGALLASWAARSDRDAEKFGTLALRSRHRGSKTAWSEQSGPSVDGPAADAGKGVAIAESEDDEPDQVAKGSGVLAFGLLALELGLAVFLPLVIFLGMAPDYRAKVNSCETLKAPEDKAGILLNLGPSQSAAPGAPAAAATVSSGAEALMVVDPLCQACKAFHHRLDSSPLTAKLPYKALLMPLDTECNWMLKDSLHPGACILSRALLCSGDQAGPMLEWFYQNQETLSVDSKAGKLDVLKVKVLAQYPAVKTCIDAPETKIKLNKALHYAVSNALPVLTPQLYLNRKRLCDEDTDLGLDYTLGQLLGKKD